MDGTDYEEAIDNASDILLEAMLGDIDALIAEGRGLDLKVKEVVFLPGRQLLVKLFEVARAMLVEEAKRTGKTVERTSEVTFKTLLGPVEVASPYMYDREAGQGERPMREHFGIVGGRYSDGAERAMADFGSESSFRDAADRFEEHYGWRPGETTVRKRTKACAEAAEAYLERRHQNARDILGKPPREQGKTADEMLVQTDGCHIRCGAWMTAAEARQQAEDPEELERLEDYEDDESVRLVEWKEVRTGLVRRPEQVEATYVCRRDDWTQIAWRLLGAACEHGMCFETQAIAIGDGAFGLKEGLQEHFPHLQFILDWYHLKHHLYETGERLLDEDILIGDVDGWVEGHLDTIYEGEAGAVIGELESLLQSLDAPPDAEGAEDTESAYGRLQRLINYLTRFYDCLDYEAYEDQDWPIGSGEVESAHKTVPQGRLKIPGATWAEENVSPMCALRVIQANDWWDDFWADEQERRQAA